jgi:large subunit ribosomal protein L25
MERMSLTAEMRTPGKGPAGRMRDTGKIPAVLYGRSVKPLSIVVDRRQFEAATKTKAGMNVMIDLSIKGGDSGLAFIRDYQADPFKRDFLHVDFQAISLTEKIEIEVPIELTGTAAGVKEGGVVVQSRRTLLVRTLPNNIPDKLTVDIAALMIGDGIHADEIVLPDGVEFPHTANYPIVAVVPPSKEEVPAAAAVAPVEGVPAEEGAPAEGAAAPAEGAAGASAAEEKGKEKAAKEKKA